MTQENNKVSNLSKVTLLLEAGTSEENMDLTPGKCHFEFIFGVAAEGMTPFEYQLLDKEVGASVVLPLRQSELEDTFGHIDVPLFRQIDEGEFFLKSTVDKVEKAQDREIVKAIAMAGGHGEACGCGCGCGG
ncbi:hypothetical protein SAMN02745216_03506 [Desulfatibacillum alkenivorans DSM 16219]|jgi:hypothetical protein|uniref:Uncharacterized protein n=1 Tax=Desulfatibacillum alkenivorans DSM 16219 TaxID=1121393 RepID=A0A1M6SRM1_9BACT|nr:hypothetical protein [Desulfatibacillum alkenivorans]SHK47238.1 hypothetical protein SAMN02745216_03506 [Desulfatibacillum alkenivorans DSM 16219]